MMTHAELATELWQEYNLPCNADDVQVAAQRLNGNGHDVTLDNLCWEIIATRAEMGVDRTAPANDPWADAPLHKLIARDMGMDDETAAEFYALIGKDY